MTYRQVKWFFAITALILMLQSCDNSDPLEITELAQVNNPNDTDADLVEDWIDLFLELERYALNMRPSASARAIAYINLAAYETVLPGMDGFKSNSGLISGLYIPDYGSQIDYQIALNTCYADVLEHFLPNVPANAGEKITDLEKENEDRFASHKPQQLIDDSKSWGVSVAAQIIAFSQTDTEAETQILDPQPSSYVPPVGTGYWTFSAEPERALFPYWARVRTFVIGTDETSTIAPPIPYSEQVSSAYFQEMEEVYQANNAAQTTNNEELWIAEFWSDDVETMMFSPPARQLSIAGQLIDRYQMSLTDALHLNLKLGFALNDAAVSIWADKYEYMVMRPSVYIQEHIDADFQTNLYRLIPWPNPSFPGYPSGHACFASAAAGIFIDFFGNNTNFTDYSHRGRDEFLSAPRNFNTFEEMAAENAYSRIPLGVHMRMDCKEGLRLGYEISDAVSRYDVR